MTSDHPAHPAPWRDRWIDLRDGFAFVRDTPISVAEIQQAWKQPGVGAVALRAMYPQLSEAQLGAAVTWTYWRPVLSLSGALAGEAAKVIELTKWLNADPLLAPPARMHWDLAIYDEAPDGSVDQHPSDEEEGLTLQEVREALRRRGITISDWRDEFGAAVNLDDLAA